MQIIISIQDLNDAFTVAENKTAEHYNSQTCSMKDRDGKDTCPICYFRMQVKRHLGLNVEVETEVVKL